MDLLYKLLIRATLLADLSGDKRCVPRADRLTCSCAVQTISWAPFRIHPAHAEFGAPAFILRERNQQFCMKYSQLADGRGRAVTSMESDPMLRLDEGTKMELFQHRPADTVTITPYRGRGLGGEWDGSRRRGTNLVLVLLLPTSSAFVTIVKPPPTQTDTPCCPHFQDKETKAQCVR